MDDEKKMIKKLSIKRSFAILFVTSIAAVVFNNGQAMQSTKKAAQTQKQAQQAQVRTTQEEDYISKIEDYFNNIRTFKSDFIQTNQFGNTSFGHFFLKKKPPMMKMDYRDPPTHVIIVKDNRMIHYNRELKEKTESSMYSSPLSFFLSKKIDIRKDLKVLSINEGDDFVAVKFCKQAENSEGAIVLVFSKNPFILRKWIVFPDKDDESLEKSTEVALINWKYDVDISDDEFGRWN